jgi:hypothetical protein
MIIQFRQGIVSYPSSGGVQQFLIPTGSNVTLSTSNGVVDATFAQRSSNYLHTEASTVNNAWAGLPSSSIVWLYWDINTLTAVRTFGFTLFAPIAQLSAPLSPTVDQHWFDTVNNVMQVWTGSRWQEKIRVFAAQYNTSNNVFTSISIHSTLQRFDGTQIGVQGFDVDAGHIIVDNTGRPILNQSKEFFTTGDDFFINGSPINTIRLEANILQASAIEPIAAYQVVTFTAFNTVGLASYDNLQTSAIAIAVEGISVGDVGSFVVQGIITNPSWNWTIVGSKLWVSTGGALIEGDPHTTDNVTYPLGKAPVARVISPTSIIFDQGMGEKGDKGDSALAGNTSGDAATQFALGKVKLTHAPIDPGSPYVVETTDPRMNDARHPLLHTHPATDVLPITFGTTINGDLQNSLENIDNIKLNKTGDIMTGMLTLAADPLTSMHAVTKQYADTFVPRSYLANPNANGIATLDNTGKIPASQLPQLAITDTFVVTNKTDLTSLNAQTGDVAIVTNEHASYILRGPSAPTLTDWEELLTKPAGILRVDVASPSPGLVISTNVSGGSAIDSTGPSGVQSGTIIINLANDSLALESLTGTGVAHRVGVDAWEVKPVDLSTSITNTLPILNGGTGLTTIFGYMKGDGTAVLSTSLTIPGADINGTVAQASSAPWSGITSTPTTLAGYGITNSYTQAQTQALTWNWSSITSAPTTLVGYGITDVYSKTEVNTFLLSKANYATTLAGYSITDAALATHNHSLDLLSNVNTTSKITGDVLSWNGTNWSSLTIGNALIPTILSGKTLDNTNTINVLDTNFTIDDEIDNTKRVMFEVSGVSPATTRVLSVPNANGTIALTDGLGATGSWNITSASTLAAAWSVISATPTTLAGYGINDAYTQTQVNNLNWNWSHITSTPTTLSGYGITDAYTQTQVNNLNWNWSHITSTPTTLAGYGISDAYTQTQTTSLMWNWSHITSTPTTLSGYGITDAALATHNHDATYVRLAQLGLNVATLGIDGFVPPSQLPAYVHTQTYSAFDEAAMLALPAHQGDLVIRTDLQTTFVLVTSDPTLFINWTAIIAPLSGAGTVTSIDIIPPVSGITVIGGPITHSGSFTLALSDDLLALENITTVGLVRRLNESMWTAGATIDLASDVEIAGILPLHHGGTGATTAVGALAVLGGVPYSGIGATGIWALDINGNANTVTNGVYNTGAYADPAWLTSLDPAKVVSTWAGSNNINTVNATVNFGNISTITNGVSFSTDLTPVVISSLYPTQHSSAKYLLQTKVTATGDLNFAELYVSVDALNNIFFSQSGPAFTPIADFNAVYNSVTGTVDIEATPLFNTPMVYKFNVTMIAA